MQNLKVNFVDFWPGFIKDNNYFFHLLNSKYDVKIDEQDPDLLFFSVDYANINQRSKYLDHRCKKIFYTGENCRPNLDGPMVHTKSRNYNTGKCDFAFSFDHIDHDRHYRLPLWILQIDWFNKKGYVNPEFILDPELINDNQFIKTPKNKFCAFIFNNPVPERIEIFQKLSEYKQVDGYGKPFNNWFYGEKNKYNILSQYRFSICFENSTSPTYGYYTEKPFHAKTAGNIPIYSSDTKIDTDFNSKAFINLQSFYNIDEMISFVKEVDQDEQLYQKLFYEPLFLNGKIPEFALPENVLKFFEEKILC